MCNWSIFYKKIQNLKQIMLKQQRLQRKLNFLEWFGKNTLLGCSHYHTLQ
jgi:hypothetical protein